MMLRKAVDSVHHPSTVDYQLSANWDLYLQAVRGTDSTVAFEFTTSAIPTTVHVRSVLILTSIFTVDIPAFATHFTPLARPKKASPTWSLPNLTANRSVHSKALRPINSTN
jgi:hypothetical protein